MPRSGRQITVAVIATAGIYLVICRLQGILLSNSNLRMRGTVRELKTEQKPCPENKHRPTLAGLLQQWDTLAKFHNISYVIGLGSLLGQYRNGDIIPWDDDVDVLIDIKLYQKLRSIADERNFVQGWDKTFRTVVQPDFELRAEKKRRRFTCYGKEVHFQVDRCSFVSPMGRVISGFRALDIFPYIINRTKGNVHDVEMKKDYNVSHFFPFQRCVFMGVQTWCPHKIRAVLYSAYEDLRPVYVCENGQWTYKGSYLKLAMNFLQSIVDYLS